jgi:hypothetical protein
MPWKKGESGNPTGRPVAEREVVELARQYSPEAIRKLAAIMRSGLPQQAIIAANSILDRAYGRPKQAVAVSAGERPGRELSESDLLALILSDPHASGSGDGTPRPPEGKGEHGKLH